MATSDRASEQVDPASTLPTLRAVTADDGRRLTVEVTGAVGGAPIFLLHGTPGSRHGPRPRSSVLYRLGVRLLSYDRPGYGGSERHRGRRVADAARDVRAIADELDLDRFSVVGRSGGGPHALACAALMPDRVVRTAVLVGLAPASAPGLDWFEGMTDGNVDDFSTADDVSMLGERLTRLALRTRSDPHSFLERLQAQMTSFDRRVVSPASVRRLLTEAYSEAFRAGPEGWIDDVAALRADWGFALDAIVAPVLFWHGAEDNFAPVSHARWMANQIRGARIRVQTSTAHFGAFEILPEILAWLMDAAAADRDGR
jgi:pimeloyl-ACP methyl ester carboxylesterase